MLYCKSNRYCQFHISTFSLTFDLEMPQVKDYTTILSSRFTRVPDHPSVRKGPSIDIHTIGKFNEK